MRITGQETVYTGKFLRIVNKHYKNGENIGIWETVERVNVEKGAVVVVAITKNNELILERNYRMAVESYVIQLPAGLMDKPGETKEEAARRELLEETGYLAGKMIPLMDAPESVVLTPTNLSHFLTTGVEYIGKENLDPAEQIEVLKIPLNRLTDFLLNLPPDTGLDLRVTGILWILEKQGVIKL
jgi:ADP-ribose pyrophosphatase